MNPTILLSIGLLLVAFAGLAIKLLLQKNGKFSGTCASNNPVVNPDKKPCGLCGNKPEQCRKA